jgi:hypothetical protein
VSATTNSGAVQTFFENGVNIGILDQKKNKFHI